MRHAGKLSKSNIKNTALRIIEDIGNVEKEEVNLNNLCTIYETFRKPEIKSELEGMGYQFYI